MNDDRVQEALGGPAWAWGQAAWAWGARTGRARRSFPSPAATKESAAGAGTYGGLVQILGSCVPALPAAVEPQDFQPGRGNLPR